MDRDSLVYKAKLAEQAERFDEMVEDMKEVAKQPQELPLRSATSSPLHTKMSSDPVVHHGV